jgi:hypothetical protein
MKAAVHERAGERKGDILLLNPGRLTHFFLSLLLFRIWHGFLPAAPSTEFTPLIYSGQALSAAEGAQDKFRRVDNPARE